MFLSMLMNGIWMTFNPPVICHVFCHACLVSGCWLVGCLGLVWGFVCWWFGKFCCVLLGLLLPEDSSWGNVTWNLSVIPGFHCAYGCYLLDPFCGAAVGLVVLSWAAGVLLAIFILGGSLNRWIVSFICLGIMAWFCCWLPWNLSVLSGIHCDYGWYLLAPFWGAAVGLVVLSWATGVFLAIFILSGSFIVGKVLLSILVFWHVSAVGCICGAGSGLMMVLLRSRVLDSGRGMEDGEMLRGEVEVHWMW